MWRKILNIFLLILFTAGLLALVGFVENEQQRIRCKGLDVNIDYQGSEAFISQDDVAQLAQRSNGRELAGSPMSAVSIELIRAALLENSYVEKVLVYGTVDGTVHIDLVQRKPLMRVMNRSGQHFYISSDGHMIPTRQDRSARVPLAHGNISEVFSATRDLKPARPLDDQIDLSVTTLQKLFLLGRYLETDAFFSALIEEVYINAYGEMELTPKTLGHIIHFEGIIDMEEKFEKLSTFYGTAMREKGWKAYRSINLKFKNQVIGTKNNPINS